MPRKNTKATKTIAREKTIMKFILFYAETHKSTPSAVEIQKYVQLVENRTISLFAIYYCLRKLIASQQLTERQKKRPNYRINPKKQNEQK